MIIPETQLEQEDGIPDEYRFWGMVQSDGKVCPANIDHCIYYTVQSVIQAPTIVGTPVRIDHIHMATPDDANIGVTVDQAKLDGSLFGLYEIRRSMFEDFVNAVERENGNIDLSFNQLVREIDAGNLALSAGLTVKAVPTPLHDFTVSQIGGWDEISIVAAPSVPGSWAWSCDGSCNVVFGEQSMSAKELNIDLETLRQSAEEGDGPAQQLVEVIQSDEFEGDETIPLEYDPVTEEFSLAQGDDSGGDCNCGAEELRQKLSNVKQERDQYKELVEGIEQKQRENVEERLRNLNQKLPEEKQYGDEELEGIIEDSKVGPLQQMATMMENLVDTKEEGVGQSNEEDLGGSSGGSQTDEELKQKKSEVDEVAKQMFGKDLDSVFDEIEQGTWGN